MKIFRIDILIDHKFIIQMTRTSVFCMSLFILTLNCMAINSYSQTARLSMKIDHPNLKDAIVEIKKQTEFDFLYSKDIEPLYQANAHVAVENGTIEEVLSQLFRNSRINYQIINKTIVLTPGKLGNTNVMQQGITITGTITDEGEPVPGVNVTIRGTLTGVVTDANGKYIITVPNKDAVLAFSFVGYISQELVVGNQIVINLSLVEDTREIEEVIVIGYGTQRKGDLTGAISSIGERDLQNRPVPNVSATLQGKVSGVMIQETGGDLSGRYQFSIRGTGSVTGSNDPLIVVDGIPLFDNNLSTINAKDIVSVNILKDASASAIYGARATNGVVIITTRRGKSGKPVVTIGVDVGFDQIAKRYEVLTTNQQRQLFVEAFKNTNRNPAVYEDTSNPVWQIETDWQKLGTRSGMRQNYSISVTGGTETNKYAISGSYVKRSGILKKSDLDEFLLRANNDISIGRKMRISTSIGGAYQRQNILTNDQWGSGAYQRLVSSHTYLPAYDDKGDFFAVSTSADPYFGENSNPLINQLTNVNQQNISRILGSVKGEYDILDGLTLGVNLGTDLGFVNGYQYLPVYEIGMYSRKEGSTTNNSRQNLNWVTDATLQYNKSWKRSNFSIMGGLSAQEYLYKNMSATGTGTIDNTLDQLSNQTSFNASGGSVTATLLSSFVRANYGFDNRYLITGTVRRDGSSKFGKEKRYGTFPSISGAWRVSEENFFKNIRPINHLKVRLGYGITGNQDIGDFAFVTRAAATPYIWGNTTVVGNSSSNMGNPNLQWESTKQFNAGIDIAFFKDRLSATLDYYNKKSENLLIQTPVPYTASVTVNPYVNLGSLQNKGFELNINSRNLEGEFTWTSNFNISFNKNEVLDIGKNALGQPLQIPGETISLPNDFANLTQEGQPVGAFYMYQFEGIWQLNEKDEAAKSGSVPGDPKFADPNGNNTLDAGDKAYVGSPLPKYFGGFANSFSYKRFTLDVFINFAGGNKLYNAMRNLNARAVPYNQQLSEIADFWTETNPSNKIPRASQGGNTTFLATRVSTNYLEDASYIRLKNLSLSYSIPEQLLSKLRMSGASVSVSATNLLTFTKYTGLDPEASSRQSLLSGGIDYTPYPLTRFYSLSLQLSF